MTMRARVVVCAAIGSVGFAQRAWAVGGTTAANVTPAQNAEFWYVGRVGNDATALNTHLCTGSYIRQGAALTAAHCINQDKSDGVAFERFQLDANQVFTLGVQHPSYNPTGLSNFDIGLLLVLNGRDRAGAEVFPTLARPRAGGAGPDALVSGDTVEVIGFTGPGGASNKRRGVMTIRNPHAGDITNDTYTYRVPPGTDFTQGGDSGGPHIHDFGGGGGGKKMVAITRNGNGLTSSTGLRVDNHNAFVAGDGVGGARVINRWVDGANTDWSTANRWNRSSANNNTKPQANDVVVLDPTVNADNAKVVTLDEDSANLDGLLNDVTLKVETKRLNVSANQGMTPGSGVLNGGIIIVGGGAAGTAGVFDAGWSLDNVGQLRVLQRGTTTLGAALPAGQPRRALNTHTTSDILVDGGVLDIKQQVLNRGLLRALNMGSITIGGDLTNDTGATISLATGGALFTPVAATVTNRGTLNSVGTGHLRTNTVKNSGTLNIAASGIYSGNTLENSGTFLVTSAKAFLNKNPGSKLTNTGTVTVSGAVTPGFLSVKTFDNKGRVKVGPSGTIQFGNRPNKGTWTSDPAMSIGWNTQVAGSGIIDGAGLEVTAGYFANYSSQNSLFDMTATELRFIDPETLTPIENVEDKTQIFDPNPVFAERNVSRLLWPSLDLTDPSPSAFGRPTLYVQDVTLTAGAGDNAGTSSIVLDGQVVTIQNKTTLDARGGVIYMSGTLNFDAASTIITDSLNPARPLADIIRPIAPGSVPANNFVLDSLNLSGANYVVLGAAFKQWGIDASGSWNVGPNWVGGFAPDDPLATAWFGEIITAPVAVAIGTPVIANSVVFDNANSYTVNGPGQLTLDAGADFQSELAVIEGTHTIAAPISLANDVFVTVAPASGLLLSGDLAGSAAVTKLGTGSVELGGSASTFSGETQVLEGMVVISGSQALGSPLGGTHVSAGAALAFQGGVNHASAEPLFIAGSGSGLGAIRNLSGNNVFGGNITLEANSTVGIDAGSLKVGTIAGGFVATKTGSGSLTTDHVRSAELAINDGLVRIAQRAMIGEPEGTSNVASLSIVGGATPTATLDITNNGFVIDYEGASTISTIRAQIGSAFASGAWSGSGITSSLANSFSLGIGYAEAVDLAIESFLGQEVDNTSIVMRLTRYGDADLTGTVNLNDFNRLAANFGVLDAVWTQADFDYNGLVNLADFNRLAANFGLMAGPDGPTPEDWAALAAAVPEPLGTLPLWLAAGLLRRSRRGI